MTLFEAIREITNNPNIDETTLEKIAHIVIDTFGDEPTMDQIASVIEQEGIDMKDSKALTFEIEGVIYSTKDRTGNYFYKTINGQKVRIKEAEFAKALGVYNDLEESAKCAEQVDAWEAEADAERQAREDKIAADAKQAEEAVAKKTKKKSKKNVAFEGVFETGEGDTFKVNHVTLTEKQVKFIKLLPNDDFYENGLDSALWIDVLCDTLAGEFNPMALGAMVSTLREKGVIFVDMDKINGKKCKFFRFTELGKRVAKELGLN